MVRHYCDVCGDEIGWINFLDLIIADDSIVMPLTEDGKRIHKELCKKCARNIAIYVLSKKCKED